MSGIASDQIVKRIGGTPGEPLRISRDDRQASGRPRPSFRPRIDRRHGELIRRLGAVLAVPAVTALLFGHAENWMRWLALAIFAAAAITDYFDGYLARVWQQQSTLGRMLDPIADKLLVAATLLMLVHAGTIQSWSI